MQLAALLSCHYCNSVPAAVCARRWQINDDDDDDDDDETLSNLFAVK